ncbi:MAG: Undecaprenyl-phosphate 4-deoxy-4-formamido-L-arabinose transferase [Alphaproteobacteria bacterium MarineAlpha3_Bin2]|nr:MAG: Undecaprenyl-phosphate 4-deoxy-4-formamido-L-arabinose transferase [Alphaproteobacteria bacterium MarineAlpha3_Bin1]PPR72261.1 MAG: Undecaprenyl-phosphate 4-deoxy-4-formamido-L-arabinose transferase [Alphaproteobacteria bacterium MarineAlpha3_Bin2]
MIAKNSTVSLAYSVVVPVRNEAGNIASLIAEISAVMAGLDAAYEIIYVDDGSTDETTAVLGEQAKGCPELRIIRHAASAGQSAAIITGINRALAPTIITLDGDGQNDPADIPKLLAAFAADADRDRLLVAGQRTRRQDPWLKRVSSKIANAVRASLLGDGTPDTGCGLKVFSRVAFNAMPAFDHMHRFLPTLMLRLGGRVLSVPVNHRSRLEGVTKYGLFDRLGVGIVDLFGVWWLKRRAARPEIESDSGRGKNGDRDA